MNSVIDRGSMLKAFDHMPKVYVVVPIELR